jgi:hypothetical protein
VADDRVGRALDLVHDLVSDLVSDWGRADVMDGDLDRAMRDYRRALELAGADWDDRAELEDWMALNDPR